MSTSAASSTQQYERSKLLAEFVTFFTQLVLLLLACLVFGPTFDRLVSSLVGQHPWARLLALGLGYSLLLELATAPLDFYSEYWLEHRFGLCNLSLRAWVWRRCKSQLLGTTFALGALAGFYALLWHTGVYWWLWAGAGWLLLSVLIAQLAPVLILPLFYKVTPLDAPELLVRLQSLADESQLRLAGIFRWELSEVTNKANAALTGLGFSRRVLLSDTLLEQFTPAEIAIVFAHELGHHVHKHLPKLLLAQALGTFAVLAGLHFGLFPWASLLGFSTRTSQPEYQDPGTLPLILLGIFVGGKLLGIVLKAYSRHCERQADTYALTKTGDPASFRSAFLKLVDLNKIALDRPRWLVWLRDNHPPVRERLALGERQEKTYLRECPNNGV